MTGSTLPPARLPACFCQRRPSPHPSPCCLVFLDRRFLHPPPCFRRAPTDFPLYRRRHVHPSLSGGALGGHRQVSRGRVQRRRQRCQHAQVGFTLLCCLDSGRLTGGAWQSLGTSLPHHTHLCLPATFPLPAQGARDGPVPVPHAWQPTLARRIAQAGRLGDIWRPDPPHPPPCQQRCLVW